MNMVDDTIDDNIILPADDAKNEEEGILNESTSNNDDENDKKIIKCIESQQRQEEGQDKPVPEQEESNEDGKKLRMAFLIIGIITMLEVIIVAIVLINKFVITNGNDDGNRWLVTRSNGYARKKRILSEKCKDTVTEYGIVGMANTCTMGRAQVHQQN